MYKKFFYRFFFLVLNGSFGGKVSFVWHSSRQKKIAVWKLKNEDCTCCFGWGNMRFWFRNWRVFHSNVFLLFWRKMLMLIIYTRVGFSGDIFLNIQKWKRNVDRQRNIASSCFFTFLFSCLKNHNVELLCLDTEFLEIFEDARYPYDYFSCAYGSQRFSVFAVPN